MFVKIENAVSVYNTLAGLFKGLSADPDASASHAALRMKLTMLDCLMSLDELTADEVIAQTGNVLDIPDGDGDNTYRVYLETALQLIRLRVEIANKADTTGAEVDELLKQNSADIAGLVSRGYPMEDVVNCLLVG